MDTPLFPLSRVETVLVFGLEIIFLDKLRLDKI